MKRLREIAIGLALMCTTLALIGAFGFYRLNDYRRSATHYDGIRKPEFGKLRFPGLTADDAVQLGWAHLENRRPESSYTKFSETKPTGVTRIGVFGCSFVYGSEAPAGADFPTLLQRLIDERGFENVEVINFGVGGYGMHQAYAMFERVGLRYALDVAIFNFYSFHRGRDDTFLTNTASYGPVHARYINRDGAPELIEVLGEDRSEAAAIYFSPIPRWRYLRHDANAPPVLQALVPRGRSLRVNPFYSSSAETRNADAIYATMIDRAAARVSDVIVACNDDEACSFSDRINAASVRVVDMIAPRTAREFSSLYRAPEAHLTALGNELVAVELLALLRGAARVQTPLLVAGRPAPFEPHDSAGPSTLTGGEIAIGDRKLAVLVERNSEAGAYAFAPADLNGRGVRALLHLVGGAELRFLPLGFQPSGGSPVEISFEMSGKPVRRVVGRIERSATGVVRIREAQLAGPGWRLEPPVVNASGIASIRTAQPIRDLEISIDGRAILSAAAPLRERQSPKLFRLEPTNGDWLLVRGRTDDATRVGDYPPFGTLDLLLATEDGRELRQPIVRFRKQTRTLRRFPEPLASKRTAPLTRGSGAAGSGNGHAVAQ